MQTSSSWKMEWGSLINRNDYFKFQSRGAAYRSCRTKYRGCRSLGFALLLPRDAPQVMPYIRLTALAPVVWSPIFRFRPHVCRFRMPDQQSIRSHIRFVCPPRISHKAPMKRLSWPASRTCWSFLGLEPSCTGTLGMTPLAMHTS